MCTEYVYLFVIVFSSLHHSSFCLSVCTCVCVMALLFWMYLNITPFTSHLFTHSFIHSVWLPQQKVDEIFDRKYKTKPCGRWASGRVSEFERARAHWSAIAIWEMVMRWNRMEMNRRMMKNWMNCVWCERVSESRSHHSTTHTDYTMYKTIENGEKLNEKIFCGNEKVALSSVYGSGQTVTTTRCTLLLLLMYERSQSNCTVRRRRYNESYFVSSLFCTTNDSQIGCKEMKRWVCECVCLTVVAMLAKTEEKQRKKNVRAPSRRRIFTTRSRPDSDWCTHSSRTVARCGAVRCT